MKKGKKAAAAAAASSSSASASAVDAEMELPDIPILEYEEIMTFDSPINAQDPYDASSAMQDDDSAPRAKRKKNINSDKSLKLKGPMEIAGSVKSGGGITFNGDFTIGERMEAYGNIELNGNMTCRYVPLSRLWPARAWALGWAREVETLPRAGPVRRLRGERRGLSRCRRRDYFTMLTAPETLQQQGQIIRKRSCEWLAVLRVSFAPLPGQLASLLRSLASSDVVHASAANLDNREKVKIFGKLTIVGTFECLKEIEVWGNLTIHGYMYDLFSFTLSRVPSPCLVSYKRGSNDR